MDPHHAYRLLSPDEMTPLLRYSRKAMPGWLVRIDDLVWSQTALLTTSTQVEGYPLNKWDGEIVRQAAAGGSAHDPNGYLAPIVLLRLAD